MKAIISFFILCFPLIISCDNLTNVNENSSWILQRDKQDDITYYSIFFSDKNNGWITGYNGTIKNTSDGGYTWQYQQSGVSANLWDISFISNLEGWICGANNTILKTTDGGKSWIDISPSNPESKIFVAIKFTDAKNGWASSNIGEILHTTNGGLTWDIKLSGLIGGSRLSVINSNTIYALCVKLYKSTNGGETWDTIRVSIPQNYMASEMVFINSNDGWIVTENGTGGTIITEFPIIITNDGGRNWVSSELLKDGGMQCIYFINENVGWVAGIQNVYKTTDGGMNWILEYGSENYNLQAKDMCFVDENNGWIITWDGKIYKYAKSFK